MNRQVTNLLSGLLSLFFIGFFACKKTVTATVRPTPLQVLVNSDTTLSLFHRMILQGNDAGVLADKPVTLFIPRNSVLRAAGFSQVIVDSMSSVLADRIIRYQYLLAAVNTDSAGYTPNPTLLGIPLYIGRDSAGNFLLNSGATAAARPTKVGQATVYWLNSPIPSAADSLTELLQTDTSLQRFAQIMARTHLYDSLLLTGSFSVLAPVNQALVKAGYDSLAIDTAKVATLIRLAENQVVRGSWFSTNFPSTLTTLTGGHISATTAGASLRFAGSGNLTPVHWLSGNELAGAGLVLHRTDGVLSP